MASANWQKHSGGTSVKAQFRHCDKNERLKVKHANEEIDTNLTYKNLSFGIFQQDYKSACHAYDERIEYIDKHAGLKKKPRKDRVTCVSWSIPQPEGMSEDMASKWFADVYALLKTEYSDVLGASAHFDEVHEYVDASTGKPAMSRPHMHVFVLPVVEKDGFRRLVGKDFSKRENIVKLNNSIQKLTEDKYPGHTFMTGVKHPGEYQPVEDLKRRSKQEQALQAEKEKSLQEVENAKAKAMAGMKMAFEKEYRELQERAKELDARESGLNAREDGLDDYEINVKGVESSTDVSKDAFMNWDCPAKGGGTFPIMRLYERFVRETNKEANAKKQNLPKHSPAPKPVNYAQKAMEEAGKQIANTILNPVQEVVKRKSLNIPWEHDEQSGDEYSY